MSVGRVVRGGLWLYLNTIATSLLGYLYWLVISNIADPSVLGETSTVIGLGSLMGLAASLGLATGAQRFLGGGLHGSRWDVGLYYGTSMTLGLIMAATSFAACFLLAGAMGFNTAIAIIGGFIALASIIEGIASSLPISALKTNVVMGVNIVGHLVRFAVGIALVLTGLGAMGTTLGYAAKQVVAVIFLGAYSLTLLKRLNWRLGFKPEAAKDLLNASFVSWLPSIIASTGSWLGVLFLYGSSGAVETGFYFIASAIASIVWALPGSFLSLTFPVLSGMDEGRKRFAWRSTRLGLAIGSPLMVLLAIYPTIPLSLMGKAYIEASTTLSILALTTVPQILGGGVGSLIYAYGYYRLVLLGGLASNIPRILLYLWLAPAYGGLGVAYSFLTGTLIGLIASIIIAKHIGFRISWHEVAIAVCIPSAAALLANVSGLHWLPGSTMVLAVSILGYARSGLVAKKDLQEVSNAILPRTITEHVHSRFTWLFGLLYGE